MATPNELPEEPTLPPRSDSSEDATVLPRKTTDSHPLSPSSSSQRGDDGDTLPGLQDATIKSVQPRFFGDYELIEEIARGGMGVVYRARQRNLKRVVALKMILAGQFAGEEDIQRFYTEAESAAQLDHPGIVPVFEIGEHQGQHYFSMGFIDGESLAEKVNEGPLDPQLAARLVSNISQAISYAHHRGVIHRDLKPANVLLDEAGQPKVTDFGLAKRTEHDSGLTGTGQILGTPAYMPPEQASGKISEVGPSADIYALGAILYCLLTGRPPFQAANPMDTLLQVLDSEPVSVRQLVQSVPRDLETICAKCLNKDPEKRYESAEALREDLQHFLASEPIVARPAGWLERASKWAYKQPTIAAILLTIPAWMLGDPKLGIGLLALVAGFHVPFDFRFVKLFLIFIGTCLASVLAITYGLVQGLAGSRSGDNVLTTWIIIIALAAPVLIVLLTFIWDCIAALENPYRARVRSVFAFGVVGILASLTLLFIYISYQGDALYGITEELLREHIGITNRAQETFTDAEATQLARGRMLVWIPVLAGSATLYFFLGVVSGRLIKRFVYSSDKSLKHLPHTHLPKTVDGDLCRWISITAYLSCLILPMFLAQMLSVYEVNLGMAFELSSVYRFRYGWGLAGTWLAAFAIGDRFNLIIALAVGGLLCIPLVAAAIDQVQEQHVLFQSAPPLSADKDYVGVSEGNWRMVNAPTLRLYQESGITMEAWIKPGKKPPMGVILLDDPGISSSSYASIRLRSDGTVYLMAKPNIAQFGATVEIDSDKVVSGPDHEREWTHVAAVIDKNDVTLFVNGESVGTQTMAASWYSKYWTFSFDQRYRGELDRLRISDTARYRDSFTPDRFYDADGDTKLMYHFEPNSDGLLFDYSGDKNHTRQLGLTLAPLQEGNADEKTESKQENKKDVNTSK